MKKKIGYILIILFMFLSINTVSAYTCSEIDTEISNYNKIVNDLSKLTCVETTDAKAAKECNTNYQLKSQSISKLYQMKTSIENSGKECKTQFDSINKIIEENKNDCGLVYDNLIIDAQKTFMTVFYILGPILVILFGSLDYTKAVMNSDADLLKKATNQFVKRMVALILLFISPVIVNIITSLSTSSYNFSGDAISCKTKFVRVKKQVTLKEKTEEELEKEKENKKSSKKSRKSSKSGMIKGEYDGYLIRTQKPTTSDKYFSASQSNTGQCVWYAQGRAIEILNTVNISSSYKNNAVAILKSYSPNAKDWWPARNNQYSKFGNSNDINKPKEGSIIVWGACKNGKHPYGHVAVIEKVYKNSSGKVTAVDYTEGWAQGGSSCPNTGMSCVQFQYNKKKSIDDIRYSSQCEPFLGYIYLLD